MYRAYDLTLERHVALKLFRGAGVEDEIVEESFRRVLLYPNHESCPALSVVAGFGRVLTGPSGLGAWPRLMNAYSRRSP